MVEEHSCRGQAMGLISCSETTRPLRGQLLVRKDWEKGLVKQGTEF